jgi:hypothetical protein
VKNIAVAFWRATISGNGLSGSLQIKQVLGFLDRHNIAKNYLKGLSNIHMKIILLKSKKQAVVGFVTKWVVSFSGPL